MKKKKNSIKIELTQEEGIVLLEFLDELDKKGKVERKGDLQLVWNIMGDIEKQSHLTINNRDYIKVLEKTRKELGKFIPSEYLKKSKK